MFAGLVASCLAEKLDYTGYEVLQVFANTVEELQFIQDQEVPARLVPWDYGRGDDVWAVQLTLHVHPDLLADLKSDITARGLRYNVISANLQSDIDMETESMRRVDGEKLAWFDEYHNYAEIMDWLDQQAAACGSGCSTINIGSSYEGRTLKVLKMTGAPNGCQQKQTIWVDAGIHAREWISHSTNMYLIDRLIQEYDTDPFVKQMRDMYDWYFLPIVNPDGYSYTWTNDRMWRKTRQPVVGSTCLGTDANRNFDFQWMTTGASNQPCSETFAGPRPYSEPEAKALSDYMLTLNGTWTLFVSLHTYGQLWMSPWGYTQALPEDYAEMARVGRASVDTILGVSGRVYQMGNAAFILYESSGTSRDWAKGVTRIPYVYTIELRNTSSFVLPATEIIPTGQEIWAAMHTTISRIQDQKPPTCIS
jgi:carboxypeptidase A2